MLLIIFFILFYFILSLLFFLVCCLSNFVEIAIALSFFNDFFAVSDGPGDSMTFNPDKTSHTVQENANLTVTCAADCKPACDFRWTKQGAAVAQGAVLSLPAVQRDQAGDYRCLADNVVHAPSSRVVTLTVLCEFLPLVSHNYYQRHNKYNHWH